MGGQPLNTGSTARNQGEGVADSTGKAKLNVGLIGLGRLGRIYARDLSTRIACTRLVAVADLDRSAVDVVLFQVQHPLRADRFAGSRLCC